MTIWWFYLIAALILLGGLGFIWLVISVSKLKPLAKKPQDLIADYNKAADQDIEHIFNDQFREELRNRGRLLFEKIINENAEFLQQDLRLTSSQLNDFMKNELTTKVREELAKYEQSINDARTLAIDSIKRTSSALDEQRKVLSDEVQAAVAKEKERIVNEFQNELAQIVSHYIVSAIGKEVSLDDQLEFILADLEANKKAIIEDIKNA